MVTILTQTINVNYCLITAFKLTLMEFVQNAVLIIIWTPTMFVSHFQIIVFKPTSMENVPIVRMIMKSIKTVFVKFKTLVCVLNTLTLTNMERSLGKTVGVVQRYVKSVQVVIIWTRIKNVRFYPRIVLKQTKKVTVQNANQDVIAKEINVIIEISEWVIHIYKRVSQKVWC